MANKGVIVAGVAAAAAGMAGLAYVLVSKGQTPPGLKSLALSASAGSVAAGGEVSVTVTALDSSGNPVSGAKGISLKEQGASIGTFAATDASGASTLQVTFNEAGTFTLSAMSGSITSNSVQVTVTSTPPPPTVATLRLSAASLSVAVGADDAVTVVADDSSGSPVAGVTGIVLTASGSSVGTFLATDTTGSSTLQVSFPSAGTYSLVARY